jgi:hypothetical protein
MNRVIFNHVFSGSAHRVHIVPRGEVWNARAGKTQVLDEAAMRAIMANFEADRRRMGGRWPGLYLGEEHHIYSGDRSSPALGWAREFSVDNDGIWAENVEWTDIGEDAIRNRRWKFTSFAADQWEDIGEKRIRILRVDTVGLTNAPTGKELLHPICNSENAFAAGGLVAIANRASSGHFRERFLMALRAHPDLIDPAATVTPEAAAAQLAILANRAPGGTWIEQWRAACAANPDLYHRASSE